MEDGSIERADVLISAVGRLHHRVLPEIERLDSFAGAKFHLLALGHLHDLAKARIGVVGTGSTAIQIAATLAGTVRALTLFQRTPQWVLPVRDMPVPWWWQLMFRLLPGYGRRHYAALQAMTEAGGRSTSRKPEAPAARNRLCLDALATVRDPVLRAKLTLTTRSAASGWWYPARSTRRCSSPASRW